MALKDKIKSLIASRYLNSIEKGENSLELCHRLEENLLKVDAEKESFNVPQKDYSINEIIELTENQYGGNTFKEFFI